jgi:hypothetical protein
LKKFGGALAEKNLKKPIKTTSIKESPNGLFSKILDFPENLKKTKIPRNLEFLEFK